ncbi:Rubredoxin-like superfamily protein [Hibiscus syriacus]|uniref:Rubredoxin-like superfamily protein n=1 Tax=Hibiscus syriacus TaxID=106335 RepID=A0A6A2Z057_HIBSY|nr:Rubredoxin-like superfamily protein [Hibiscus syriacus]
MNKINSGKEFSFKSPHDQATFEISRKIWSNSVCKVEDNVLDYDENSTNNSVTNINLLDESGEKKNFTPKSPATRKGSRNKGGKMRERSVLNDGFVISNNNFNNKSDHDHSNAEGFGGGTGGVGGGGSGGGGGGERGNVATVIEETVKCCLTPMFKVVFGSLIWGVGGCGGRGISGLAMNAMPLNFGNFGAGGVGNGDLIDERWRKQQILELEVYSKRLELVQDQIKAALEEVRSMGG